MAGLVGGGDLQLALHCSESGSQNHQRLSRKTWAGGEASSCSSWRLCLLNPRLFFSPQFWGGGGEEDVGKERELASLFFFFFFLFFEKKAGHSQIKFVG